MQSDLDPRHPRIGEDAVGDLPGHRLDEIAARTRNDGGGALGELTVVQGVAQIIARRSGRKIEPGDDVDEEILPVALLVVEHAVIAADP